MLLLSVFCGCLTRPIAIGTPASSPAASQDTPVDWFDYAACLKRCVVDGKVDYAILCGDHRGLDRTLAAMARRGPETTPRAYPDRNARLAYWINAYNAAVLRSVVEQVRKPEPGMMAMIPIRLPRDPVLGYTLIIDGHSRTPAQIRNEALRLAGDDWRVRFVLCDGHVVGPPLFHEPFYGDLFDAQLAEALAQALESPQVVWIDHGMQRLCVWSGLNALRVRLIDEFRRRAGVDQARMFNVLLEYASPQRRLVLNSAVGYEDCTLPDDNSLNQAPAVR